MFRGWFVVSALLVLFGSTAVTGAVATFRARGVAARIDAGAVGVLGVVMSGVALGWAPLAGMPLGVVVGVIFAWFVVRTIYRIGRPEGTVRVPVIYGAVVTALSGWVLLSAAGGGGSATDHPGHELGTILIDLMGALLMFFAAAGWLLGTFAMPAESKSRPVAPLAGIREACMAAGLAVAFYAIS